jgi:hypothetical protein
MAPSGIRVRRSGWHTGISPPRRTFSYGSKQCSPIGPGDLLVPNFNDQANLQGAGSTINRIFTELVTRM